MIDIHTLGLYPGEREKEEKKKKEEKKEKKEKKREYTASSAGGLLAVYSAECGILGGLLFGSHWYTVYSKKKKREGESMQYTPKIEHSVYEFFSACGRLNNAS